jgi:lantibiotic modifying enzyme
MRVGTVLDDETWHTRGLSLMSDALSTVSQEHPLDVIGGNAGAIFALLGAASHIKAPLLLSNAIRLGEELAAAATEENGTWAWQSKRATGTDMALRPLTGFAHGASGMGLALLELATRVDRKDLYERGLAAFDYERLWYNEQRRNWADVRSWKPGVEEQSLAYAVSWCHGACGIGLARSRALELLPLETGLLSDLEVAAKTTGDYLGQLLRERRTDVTFCHGVAGLTEFLVAAANVLNVPGLAQEAVDAWSKLLDRHLGQDDWPSGLPSMGKTPGLMIGTAGVGYTLLRLGRSRQVKSALLPVG